MKRKEKKLLREAVGFALEHPVEVAERAMKIPETAPRRKWMAVLGGTAAVLGIAALAVVVMFGVGYLIARLDRQNPVLVDPEPTPWETEPSGPESTPVPDDKVTLSEPLVLDPRVGRQMDDWGTVSAEGYFYYMDYTPDRPGMGLFRVPVDGSTPTECVHVGYGGQINYYAAQRLIFFVDNERSLYSYDIARGEVEVWDIGARVWQALVLGDTLYTARVPLDAESVNETDEMFFVATDLQTRQETEMATPVETPGAYEVYLLNDGLELVVFIRDAEGQTHWRWTPEGEVMMAYGPYPQDIEIGYQEENRRTVTNMLTGESAYVPFNVILHCDGRYVLGASGYLGEGITMFMENVASYDLLTGELYPLEDVRRFRGE